MSRRSKKAQELFNATLHGKERAIKKKFTDQLSTFNFTIDTASPDQQLQQLLLGIVKFRIKNVIEQHNLPELKLHLGPALYLMQQSYQYHYLQRLKKWLIAKSKVNFATKVSELLLWFSRLHPYQQLWEAFENAVITQPIFFVTSKRGHTTPARQKFKKLSPTYQAAMEAYHERGLSAYIEVLKETPMWLWDFLTTRWEQAVLIDPSLPSKSGKLTAEQQQELIKILQQALYSNQTSGESKHESTQEYDQESKALVVHQTVRELEAHDLHHTHWQKERELVIQKHEQSLVQQITAWLKTIENIITGTNGDMPSILEKFYLIYEDDVRSSADLYETQRLAFETYKIEKMKQEADYDRENAPPLLDTECKIGEIPLDTLRFVDDSNVQITELTLLHLAMAEYQRMRFRFGSTDTATLAASEIVVCLLNRGMSPGEKNSIEQDTWEYAEIDVNDPIRSQWLQKLSPEIAVTPEAQKALTQLQNELFYTSNWFLGLFYRKAYKEAVLQQASTGILPTILLITRAPQEHSTELQRILTDKNYFRRPMLLMPPQKEVELVPTVVTNKTHLLANSSGVPNYFSTS